MTTLADKSLLLGGDNKPPMLEKHLFTRLAINHCGWVTNFKEYTELTPAEAIQADCDIKAINIILQGLPTEIYALVSQHHVTKDLWEKIKLLMQGTSLTKQERELLTLQTSQTVITHNAAYQADDLDAYDYLITNIVFVLDQNAPSFTQLFELSELRAQSQEKDTVIVKLKEQIKSLRGNVDDSKVKMAWMKLSTHNN
ncbi:hypothetical protein Tco_0381531 [Tanacetum coccineum]